MTTLPSRLPPMTRVLIAVAGLMGAAGVAAAAAGAHVGGAFLPSVAEILMVHAAAVVGLAALGARRPGFDGLTLAAAVLAVGAILFGGDLALRDLADTRLFPNAAPTGGFAMIAGWLIAAGAVVLRG